MQNLNKIIYSVLILFSLIFQISLCSAEIPSLESKVGKTIDTYPFLRNKEKKKVERLWKKLNSSGYVAIEGKDSELRQLAVTFQEIMESSIAESLENGAALSVVGIIHTPTPPTPLRVKDLSSIENFIPEHNRGDSQVIKTLGNRHMILLKLLKLKGTLIAAYSKDISTSKIPGYNNFLNLTKSYTNLIDKPIKHLTPDLSGATYLVKDNSGNITVFSLHSTQINKQLVGEQKWKLWFGDIKNKKIAKRMVKIDSFLKAEDVDIYQYLN
ncbi:hypothetical protein NF27_IN00110 [Candidatus Jidaibacter acanthamoeba]|uniref:Uncharacterized protein n=1 Tax=Candidatus Jidaibacter acanthamoebae TaxID=86105 RepID=A0A0C1QW95_9RICK|nr:hypothetical protein [Candidatus Jidaibacter acanthamoeba]KIE04270.1 hypothetical protein NF27_IN00110 [Candidatus Jidaibacter acanthamoeba]